MAFAITIKQHNHVLRINSRFQLSIIRNRVWLRRYRNGKQFFLYSSEAEFFVKAFHSRPGKQIDEIGVCFVLLNDTLQQLCRQSLVLVARVSHDGSDLNRLCLLLVNMYCECAYRNIRDNLSIISESMRVLT